MGLARFGGFLVFSIILTLGMDHAWILIRRTSWRRQAGLCTSCAYDCTNLPTTTCPECGQLHTILIESPAQDSNA